MEKHEAAMFLEDELIGIFDMAERIQCMLYDITENFLCDHDQCKSKEEYGRASTRISVAREAADRICEDLDKLLS